jgi:pyruvate, orthophosphate dikinase
MQVQASRYVYRFGNGIAEGDRTQKKLLGGKGANLAEMSLIGLPVPAGFTISTEACAYVLQHGSWPEGLEEELRAGLKHLEEAFDRRFGDVERPLLVSVRSGAAVSMPGMMDTVLNLGLNDEAVEGLARETGNAQFAFDGYRRFLDMFGDVVMGVPHEHFEEAMQALKDERGVKEDMDLTDEDLRTLVNRYKAIYREHSGRLFPADPLEQLRLSVNAVFNSWNSDRAERYRRIHGITGLNGTAVNVQAMVFGNLGDTSGTGVCFTRNPANGEPELYGEFLINAQGEDVVAGIRTPQPIVAMADAFPDAFEQLVATARQLEQHYKQMQDIEFTIQEAKLYILQTRSGKRTGAAAVRIAVDLVNEGLVEPADAIRDLVEPRHIDQLLHPRFASENGYHERVLGKGLAASPGAAVGRAVFSADTAEEWVARGERVVLVRVETSPEDVGGMHAAEGILTARGGITSHAAVVARGWGKPCVAGCDDIVVNTRDRSFTNGRVTVNEGDWISINGSSGEVILGAEELIPPAMSGHFETVMEWADRFRRLGVRANADTPDDGLQAVAFGAEGIGLCRTEHMFFGDDRIWAMRRMILASTDAERNAALLELLPLQRADFEGLFRAMAGRPLTIRLLDPPLHEFLPHEGAELTYAAARLGIPEDQLRARVARLHEQNPMLGHRGCRLGITFPEISEMQARAIIEAALAVKSEGIPVQPEIMVPLIGTRAELADQRRRIEAVAETVFAETGSRADMLVGTMIEVPRAALTAGEIAKEADFFSFGTNDLTQLTFGYSRDDAGSFLPYYVDKGILPDDPFHTLDQEGVGEMMQIAIDRGRRTRPDVKLGVCGEHGGDPASVEFCHRIGLDYVSCSPFRVPVARLAAAQAHLRDAEQAQPIERAAAPAPGGLATPVTAPG